MGPRENAERSFNTQPDEIYGKDSMMESEPLPFNPRGQHTKSFSIFDIACYSTFSILLEQGCED